MLFNYQIIFSYDGSEFYGMQKQLKQRTVQGVLEAILTRLNGNEAISLKYASRTDKGVHALKQVGSFETNHELNLYYVLHALNLALPNDVFVKDIKRVANNFHPRYLAIKKHYRYLINLNEYDPLLRNQMWFINKELALDKMKECLPLLIGRHDFRTFSSVSNKKNSIREIYDIIIVKNKGIISIDFYGDGFLRYMIRKLVMILIEIGLNKKNKEDLVNLLNKKDISAYSQVAISSGLYLMEVYYD
ncbi:MAG: tRNA pseudouridine(38-40) synthase TruA [Bacilli bacterium]|jgi:tRNA pseudouridine38-40 synthase|nr:tRNA pseudouridine(38-40) synthase TruA [Bacilli bacterium]